MIIYKRGNLLEDEAEALVNAVNTVGVMGAGIAKQFKQKFPDMFLVYEQACKAGELKLGRVQVVPVESKSEKKYVINFPTLEHWSDRSTLDHIRMGLEDLVRVVKEKKIQSIAIPPLGCGVGGLDWQEVKPLIEKAFEALPGVRVHLYEPL